MPLNDFSDVSFVGPWQIFTRLGESQILLPAAALVVLSLLRQPAGRALARRWLMLLFIGTGLTTLSKLAFIGWGIGSAALDFTGISGHAMFAAAIHPLLFGTLVPSTRPWPRRAAVALGMVLALVLAFSRVVVDAHSVSESAAGFVLGSAVGCVALGLGTLPTRLGLWMLPLVAVWLAVTPVVAPPSQTHSMVTRLALALSGNSQPYTRSDLHARRQAIRPADRP